MPKTWRQHRHPTFALRLGMIHLHHGKAAVVTQEDLKDEGLAVHVEKSQMSENSTTLRLLTKMGDDIRLGLFVPAMA